ncbi:MAG: hypothetical protein M0R77_07600 [Gammaproteobacteria bacterium]|nr:hypothetical protein [Gammaproteobacteria bacterium]
MEDVRTIDIKIPEQWLEAVSREMERVFNIPKRQTKQYLQEHMQAQYNALENKEGRVSIEVPTVENFKEYIHGRMVGTTA